MSVAEIVQGLEALPEPERATIARRALEILYPESGGLIGRVMRRLQHPDVPEDFWEAIEEVEEGKALEMHDAHFVNPPL